MNPKGCVSNILCRKENETKAQSYRKIGGMTLLLSFSDLLAILALAVAILAILSIPANRRLCRRFTGWLIKRETLSYVAHVATILVFILMIFSLFGGDAKSCQPTCGFEVPRVTIPLPPKGHVEVPKPGRQEHE